MGWVYGIVTVHFIAFRGHADVKHICRTTYTVYYYVRYYYITYLVQMLYAVQQTIVRINAQVIIKILYSDWEVYYYYYVYIYIVLRSSSSSQHNNGNNNNYDGCGLLISIDNILLGMYEYYTFIHVIFSNSFAHQRRIGKKVHRIIIIIIIIEHHHVSPYIVDYKIII